MIEKKSFLTLAVIGVGVTACGGGTDPVIDRNNPGTGTLTLEVQADIDANAVVGGFVTNFDVTVKDAEGNAVSEATVTIENSSIGTLTLLETSVGSGDYRATRNAFPDGDFELNVIRGTDNVENVVLGGPGVHTITSPSANDIVPALQAITVTWDRPSTALSAELETRDYASGVLLDAGTAVIPAAENVANSVQRVRVFRFNEVSIASGLPGSRMRVEVRRTIEPIVVQ